MVTLWTGDRFHLRLNLSEFRLPRQLGGGLAGVDGFICTEGGMADTGPMSFSWFALVFDVLMHVLVLGVSHTRESRGLHHL